MNRVNNFSLLRLAAAIQVVLWHTISHLELNVPGIFEKALKYFPGVPIFFVISGFLIFQSIDRKPNLNIYTRNRLLRIYPALWVAFVVSAITVVMFGYRPDTFAQSVKWILAQVTIFQNYTPENIQEYALTHPNLSLWTVPIELTFYLFVPLLYFTCTKLRINKSLVMIIVIIASFLYNYYLLKLRDRNIELFHILNKQTFPYLFYFMLGSLLYVNWERIKGFYVNRAHIWLIIYVSYVLVASVKLELYEQLYWINGFGLVGMILLAQLTISAAYTLPNLSHKLLGNVDISYGIYLYHMIYASMLYELRYFHKPWCLAVVLVFTIISALISWKLIEEPILSKKDWKAKALLARNG